MAAAKIALFDIETAPNLGWVWGKWQQDVIDFRQHWFMLSYSYKWLGSKKVETLALPHYKGYDAHKEDDEKLVRDLWNVLDEADVVIAHNGDKFDIRKTNARFIYHGLKPPSPYKSIDTLKIAKKHFAFDSNRLDDLGHYLGVGRKLPITGKKDLWLRCMRGDREAWDRMIKYNTQDVNLLERVYSKLRPWSSTHPDLGMYSRKIACPSCQSSKLHKRGVVVTKTGQRDRFHCQDCGAWSSGGKHTRVVRN